MIDGELPSMMDSPIGHPGGFQMKRSFCAILLSLILAWSAMPAYSQAARQATIEPETKIRLILQSRLSSKLNEPGDPVVAVLDEPVYVDSQLVLARGTEFHGRVTEVKAAGRGMKGGAIAILFERVVMPWGDEPVSLVLAAIDDWDKNEKMKADEEGKVKGGKNGGKAVDNVYKGGGIGGAGAGVIVLTSRGAGPAVPIAGAAIGVSMLAGLLLTKGGEIQVLPGAVLRMKFAKPITLPVIQTPGAVPSPIQQDGDEKKGN
jgi:hypothetical protein